MTTLVQTNIRNGVGIIEFTQPKRFNCLSMEVFRQFGAAIKSFEEDTTVGVVLLCAQGKNFCTGAELDEVIALRQNAGRLRAFLEQGHAVLNAIEDSHLPVVAAVQGLCLAGGLEVVMACDVVMAATDARFGDQHAQFGLVPGWGGSARLPRLVGQRRAMDLMLSARWISADEAQNWGLISHVIEPDQLHDQAYSYCHAVTQRSRTGIALMKRLSSLAARDRLRADLRTETDCVVPVLMGADATEGLRAFKERRTPKFF